jgi:hypothetical protein
MRPRPLIAFLLAACLAWGCEVSGGISVSNESPSTVLVQFEDKSDGAASLRTYEVPSRGFGLTLSGIGQSPWNGRIRVLDIECRLIFERRVKALQGHVVVASDGSVTWSTSSLSAPSPSSDERSSRITPTDKCERSAMSQSE